MKLVKIYRTDGNEMLEAFETSCPKIFNSRASMSSGNMFSFTPAYRVQGEQFYGDIEISFHNGVITMNAKVGPSGFPYPGNDCKVAERATVRSANDVVNVLKQFRKKQQKEFKDYFRNY